ncbi:MAG: sugar transferase [Syntrophales bacterium]|nr:sugar transferase [Syntrophales bacterium]
MDIEGDGRRSMAETICRSPVKVAFDVHYLEHRSLMFDMKILFLTLLKVLRSEGFTH